MFVLNKLKQTQSSIEDFMNNYIGLTDLGNDEFFT